MKKILLSFFSFFFIVHAYSVTPQDIDTAIYKLSKQIMINEPLDYKIEYYAELAYLKRTYNLIAIHTNDSIYLKKRVYNNFYYDIFRLYGKFFKDDAIVTEDCLDIPESTAKMYKPEHTLFYALYPESIKIPANYINQLEIAASYDEIIGKLKALNAIYYLKKYNLQNLSATQKSQLSTLEQKVSQDLFKTYIENSPWTSYRLWAVSALKKNNNPLVKAIDISDLVTYYKNNNPLNYFETDLQYKDSLAQLGGNRIKTQNALALLWIFLLENK